MGLPGAPQEEAGLTRKFETSHVGGATCRTPPIPRSVLEKDPRPGANANALFVIGRGLDYACALEGGLKTKEISYIHAEAYPAGELKHGTISLIEDGTLVVGVLTQERLFEKTVSNMSEVKSRGAYLFAVTTYGNYETEELADFTFYIPRTDEHFAVSLAVIPLQLTAYYISVARGVDVDKPRNLAKSVTVE